MGTKKICAVRCCKNTSENTKKLFIQCPRSATAREKWLEILNHTTYSVGTKLYCCEDHFDLQNDMENWVEYQTIGICMRMKPDVVPHKYLMNPKPFDPECESQFSESARKRKLEMLETLQSSRKPRSSFEHLTTTTTTQREAEFNNQIVNVVTSPSGNFNVCGILYPVETVENLAVGTQEPFYYTVEDPVQELPPSPPPPIVKVHKGIQTKIRPKFRSVAVNTRNNVNVRSCATSTDDLDDVNIPTKRKKRGKRR